MNAQETVARLAEKTPLLAMQLELQHGYGLSLVEARTLAERVQQLVDEQTDVDRHPGQVVYPAIAVDEPPGKPLRQCRKVSVQLTLQSAEDAQVWASAGPTALRRLRVHRLVYEALLQGGALSQEDLGCLLGISCKTVKRIFAYYRQQGQRLPSRGEIQDMGAGVSHKIPVVRKYIQDLSFTRIAQELGQHGVGSMARYLRHFALVMVLQQRGLSVAQMKSVIGISEGLIQQYQALYVELNVPENQRTLDRLRQTVFHGCSSEEEQETQTDPAAPSSEGAESAQHPGSASGEGQEAPKDPEPATEAGEKGGAA